jgi:hypothetical protein
MLKPLDSLAILATSALALWSSTGHASICTDQTRRTGFYQQQGIHIKEVFFEDCKVLSYRPQQVLIAMVHSPHRVHDGESFFLELFLLDRHTNALLRSYRDPKEIISDAISLTGVEIDTTSYPIQPQSSAIAVRLNYSSSLRYPYQLQSLSLYDLTHRKKLLDSLLVQFNHGTWDGICKGQWQQRRSQLTILNTQQHGYRNILVSSRTQLANPNLNNYQRCARFFNQKGNSQFVLKFDGLGYQIPTAFPQHFND